MKKNSTQFQKEVWRSLAKIPKGKVTTYGEIAKFLGKPKAYRAVGSAVGKNPKAPEVPCHRVVSTDGKVGNYSGKGGVNEKIKLLKSEGINIEKGEVENFSKVFYSMVK